MIFCNLWRSRPVIMITGIVVLGAGLGYYEFFRPENTLINALFSGGNHTGAAAPWLPSFIFVLGFSLLHCTLARPRSPSWVVWLWIGLNSLWESGQLFQIQTAAAFRLGFDLLQGHFDPWDAIAGLAGGLIGLWLYNRQTPSSLCRSPVTGSRIIGSCMLTLGLLSAMGTSLCNEEHCYRLNDPVYLSYADLRNAIVTSDDEDLLTMGKIYHYRDWLFINEPNKGIHIFDNTTPEKPDYLIFIHIPGNLDMAIRDGYLYVDSFVDLVVLDIRDPQNIQEVHRIEYVFPYNPYQAIPDDVLLGYVDEEKGVVLDYER